jgi:predicted transcriptional regulator
MIMAPSRSRSWDDATIEHGSAAADAAKVSGWGKRVGAIAAVAVLAAIAGVVGGSFATSGSGHGAAAEQSSAATSRTQAMEATIKRLESEVAALKAGTDRAAKGDASQFAKVNDRLDKMEKAHADSASKLAKLHDSVEKQHVAAVPAASSASAKDVTGSIPTAAAAPVPLPSPKPEFARLPTIPDWVLRDVANGGAVIEGRTGIYEVYAGDPVPGLGRIDAIRKQDGRWVVVTRRGLVVSR